MVALAIPAFVVGALAWYLVSGRPDVDRLAAQAAAALREGDVERAGRLAETVLAADPAHAPALLIAGEVDVRRERYDDAVARYTAIPSTAGEAFVTGHFAAAEVLRHLGRLDEAARELQLVLEARPDHENALVRLPHVLDLQGRRWEARPHQLEILRRRGPTLPLLLKLGSRESAVSVGDELERLERLRPDAFGPRIGRARRDFAEKRFDEARRLLEGVTGSAECPLEAWALLGLTLAELDGDRLPDWNAELPAEAASHPDVWVARGLWARRAGQRREAARCFWEALRRDPQQRTACHQLGLLLRGGPHDTVAGRFAERAERLQSIAATMQQLVLDPRDVESMAEAARLMDATGRTLESRGWFTLLLEREPDRDEVRVDASHALDGIRDGDRPGEWVDLSDWPEPRWSPANVVPEPSSRRGPRFVDRATEAGLDFSYVNGRDPDEEGIRMYAFGGGGIAVLDYDCDGRPDLYFVQGGDWPAVRESVEHTDRLFRNLGTGRFVDVTVEAGLGDGWFGQGVAVGDFDSDGTPDIYVANIGGNRLYLNRGDGTFEDVTGASGLANVPPQWTTSCVIADLDADGHPDLYDVNYLTGDDVFDRLCTFEGGRQRACVPGVFSPAADVFLRNDGEGRFVAVDSARPNPAAGMGAIAADFDADGRTELFVANDVSANFLLRVERSDGPGDVAKSALEVSDDALATGLAFDRDGRAQACMGIASGDIDGDGRLDLYVTNYHGEHNTLYAQTLPGLFSDASRGVALFKPSFRMLGFGTQTLDADNDGWLDLVVANGHVDDFRFRGHGYRMRPQFLHNLGGGRFAERTEAEGIGDYFQRELLGRSLARLDWDRDGDDDFVVSHLEQPATLASNESASTGHWIAVRLVGRWNRDAVGAIVTAATSDRRIVRHVTAGDGYLCSNERRLTIGLGEHSGPVQLEIDWPSGHHSVKTNLAADREWLLVEGHPPLEMVGPFTIR